MQNETILKYENDELAELAAQQSRLVVAANGMFRERHTAMFSTSTRVEPADLLLAEHYQYCYLNCGTLDPEMHGDMLAFFRYANELHGGEAALVLLYHPEQRQFLWHCPVQTVEMHWSYDRWVVSDLITFENPTVLPEGYVHFGDAHLHVGPVTTPSVIDIRDDEDGMHIIVGDIERAAQYHIDFVIDGKRFGVATTLMFEDPNCLPCAQPPSDWLNNIQIERRILYQPNNYQSFGTQPDRTGDDWSDGENWSNPRNGDSEA